MIRRRSDSFSNITFVSLRFPPDPILVSFTATTANATYSAAERTVGHRNTYERLNIDASSLNPAVYIDPLLQGACFFSQVEVQVDKVEVGDASLTDKGFLYQKAHRTFTTSENRKKTYGSSIKWISTTAQRTATAAIGEVQYAPRVMNQAGDAVVSAAVAYRPAQPVRMSEEMKYAVQSLTFDSETSTITGTIACGMDGVFPLNQQCNALRAITGIESENKFLPPDCEVFIKLHKRVPLDMAIEKSNVTDAAYFSSTGQTANTFKIVITDISIMYDSITVTDSDQAKLKAQTHTFYFDAPILRVNPMASGTRNDTITVPIPKGAKFAYLCFVYEDQVTHNTAVNSFLSPRLRFPPNLIDFKIDLPGRAGLLFAEGIKNMGVAAGYGSVSLRSYHADLLRRGLYDKPFEEFFPPWRDNNRGYDQAILVDLTYTDNKETDLLTCVLKYDSNYGAARWQLNTFFVVQQCVTCTGSKKWSFETV